MKQRALLALATILTLASVACTSGNKQTDTTAETVRERIEGEATENPLVEQLDNVPNEALTATLLEQEDDSLVLRNNDTGLQLVLAYREALHNDSLRGSLTTGNDYSIMADMQGRTIASAINLTELQGRWFYDMTQHRGLRFEPKGAISSINADEYDFRQWRMVNGQLYLYYLTFDMVAPERSEYLVEPAYILQLSSDHLLFRFLGRDFDCHRQTGVIKLNR